MGYYTSYKLEIKGADDAEKEWLVAQLRAVSDEAKFCLSERGGIGDAGKWYEHEDDLRKFSQKCPSHLLILHAEGQQPGDLWRKYFKNGKCQEARAVVTYPEFDEKLLT